jgi:kynureninase
LTTQKRFTTNESFARDLDRDDPLSRFRKRFHYPSDKIYFDGNSLGLLSKDAETRLGRVIGEWKHLAIGGWMDAERPWVSFAERLGGAMSKFVGAKPEEVVCTGTTTVNLHALVSTFYTPRPGRTRIVADDLTFPSDVYALSSQVRLRGLDAKDDLVFAPTKDCRFLDEGQIENLLGDNVALLLLPSVLYRSGQLLDMKRLTRVAHEHGIVVGFDCSHSAGVVPHHFDDWDVDFAFWCSYKYLNGGPGCPAFLYVNRRHFDKEPGLAGWFGYVKEKQFEMIPRFDHDRSAGGWQISSPGIIGSAPIEASLDIMAEAGIDAVRQKSLSMTTYLINLIDHLLPPGQHGVAIGSPREEHRRGGHVAVEHERAADVFEALVKRGIIGDLRRPNVIRLCPSPLYNTYLETWQVANHLKEIVGGV